MIDLQRLRTARGVDLTAWPPRYDPAYLPSDEEEYWLPEMECAGEADRNEIIFGKLRNQIRYAWERSPFYRRRWQEAGVSPDTLKSVDDLSRFPVIQKSEMRVAQETKPPFGDLLCIEAEEIARIHGTSGTTGRPVVFGIGRDDWDRIANAHPRDFGLRILFFSGEPGAGIPATKRLIEETFGGTCIDMGSMAEMTPWMTNGECRHRTGMHLWQDIVYAEVCDPDTYRPVPFGAEGTPVYTHLERTSQPMIRLASNDRTRWINSPCPCGRTYPRLPHGIYGRYDDVFIIRGKNLYPSAIEDALRGVEGFGGEFQVIISRQETMDELLIRAEYVPAGSGQDSIDALKIMMWERIRARLGVRPILELVPQGSLPRTEFKARRVIDDRDVYRTSLGKLP